jgi:collagenase-like PrtC family protease
MIITSAASVQFAQELGYKVVQAREYSIEEVSKIHSTIGVS